MKRVVVTGFGIVSSIGNNSKEVLHSLLESKSGLVFVKTYQEKGFRSLVHGSIDIDFSDYFTRKELRYMSDGAGYAYIAAREALEMAGLGDKESHDERTGIIAGIGGIAGPKDIFEAWETLKEKQKTRYITPFIVPRAMASSISANLATSLKIRGTSYSICSACATSSHCIGHAYELIQFGKQDVVLAGGSESLHWMQASFFDAMKALSSNFNETPATSSKPYDRDRDGFVFSGGGGIVILEELGHAQARNAPIFAEITGYGATSDGDSMAQPSGEGAERCMKLAASTVKKPIDYINTHATSTPIGDKMEAQAIISMFGNDVPAISSTKALTGHSLGAAGAHEMVYCLLMMQNDFLAASNHIENIDPDFKNLPVLRENKKTPVNTIMSNSFGFGGTNATLIFEKF